MEQGAWPHRGSASDDDGCSGHDDVAIALPGGSARPNDNAAVSALRFLHLRTSRQG